MIPEKAEYDAIQEAFKEFPKVRLRTGSGTTIGVTQHRDFRALFQSDKPHLHEAFRDALEILFPSIQALAKANLERQLKAATEKAQLAAREFIDETS